MFSYPKKNSDFVPAHYRETPIELFDGKKVLVAALAKPNYAGQSALDTFEFLKIENIHTVFGLEADPSFASIASSQEIDYVNVSIPDFSAPTTDIYDAVYNKLLEESSVDKKIAIHCHGGMGRTGAVLASLKIRELINKSPEESDLLDLSVQLSYPYTNCTPLVKKAIDFIRSIDGNEHTIEVEEQVQSLCLYQESLLHRKKPITHKKF